MKNLSHKLKLALPAITLAIFMPLSAQAATLEDVVTSIDKFREELISWLGAAKDLYLEHLYEESPDYPTTIAANTSTSSFTSTVDEKTTALAMPTIKDLLTQENTDRLSRIMAAAPASDIVPPATAARPFSVTGAKPQTDTSEGDAYLYAGTLLDPLAYRVEKKQQTAGEKPEDTSTPTAKAAFGFLQFAASLGQPLGLKLTESEKELFETRVGTSETLREYRVTLRSMIAARSIAIDNLLKVYAKRLTIEGLGEKAGMPDQKDASPAEVEQYIATRRVTNEGWYNSMAEASAATIARETLFVLVEIQQQIYGLRQDNEKILTTLSIMELNTLESQKEALKAKEEDVKRALGIQQ